MKKRITKIMMIIIGIVLGICLMAVLWLAVVSKGTVESYTDENGAVLENSIAEKIKLPVNGVDNGMIIRGKSLDNPVLLFISSGPGTPDYFLNQQYPDMNLEDYYTVCYWEYRGTAMVYDKNMNPETITTDQMIADTVAVTEYLKQRFGKEKIYLMAFSGGTHMGIQTAARYPENYYAYIAMAQAVSADADNDTLMYDFMKKVFTERKDKSRLRKLEACVTQLPENRVKCNDWLGYVMLLHDAGGGTIKDKTEFEGIIVPILKAHCYTLKEKFDYIKGMKMYRKTPFYADCKQQDYRKTITELNIPVFFLSGSYDYNCPWPLVEEYCEMLHAPQKGFFTFDEAAHSPLWEQADEAVSLLAGEVRDLSKSSN